MALEAFDRHFTEIYGNRWPALRAALVAPPRQIELANPFGLNSYRLDEASAIAARALDVAPGHRVLDLCASPGGKAITQIFDLRGEAEWVLNDLSAARTARLRAIVHDCIPTELHSRVRVINKDGSRIGQRFPAHFDRVLVDAPCSGERHLIAKASEMERWSPKASKRLQVRQHALLCSGLDSLKTGGRLVYSTCTLEPQENDGVIEKLGKSRADRFEVVKEDGRGEPTIHGHILMPDQAGCGPIYYATLTKR